MPRLSLPSPYEELDHTADVGVVVRGDDPEQTLGRLVLALSQLLSGGGPVREQREIRVTVEPADRAAMAVDVLREVLFVFESERVLPASAETLRFDPGLGAEVVVGVGPYDDEAHAEGLELKAITLHEARFERVGAGWMAQIVFDI